MPPVACLQSVFPVSPLTATSAPEPGPAAVRRFTVAGGAFGMETTTTPSPARISLVPSVPLTVVMTSPVAASRIDSGARNPSVA